MSNSAGPLLAPTGAEADREGMIFADRRDAGRKLAARLEHLSAADAVVLGLPRGGVPVAYEVAEALDKPLDAIIVRKLGAPFNAEFAIGAIGEGGVRVLDEAAIRALGVRESELIAIERRERAELQERVIRFRSGRDPIPLAGRAAILIDDGVATGSTVRAATQVVRALDAARIVLAMPVGPPGWDAGIGADEVICLATPERFFAVGQWYTDFTQTSDDEVIELLGRRRAATGGRRETGSDR